MNEENVPRHVAVIMDGNGRWAKKRLLPRAAGHRAGLKRMLALSEHAFDCGVRFLTLYALSVENLSRPQEELDALFGLFRSYFAEETERLEKRGVSLRVIGNADLLPPDIRGMIREKSREEEGERGTLALAIGYGSRQEIVAAANRAVREGREVDEEAFSRLLQTDGMPDPDLVIRTGKEVRLSNFLLWQAAYAELYFTDKMFPDFTNADFDRALEAYSRRDRRYGKVGNDGR